MIWGLEGRHVWTPPGGPVAIRQNWMPNPKSDLAKMLTSSGAYNTSQVKWAAEGITTAPPGASEFVDLSTFASAVDTNTGFLPFTFPRGGYWLMAAYLWFPENWDGGDITLEIEGYTGAVIVPKIRTGLASVKKSWQRVGAAATIAPSDLSGNLVFRTTKQPTVGRKVFFSSFLIERTPWHMDVNVGKSLPTYFPSATQLAAKEAAWDGAAGSSTSRLLGSPITLGNVYDDAGAVQWPHYKLKAVTGLIGLGDAEDNRDRPPGRVGELARLSQRRGKAITYEGWIRAKNLRQLREADERLRQAFANVEAEGRMDVSPHPLNPDFPGEPKKFYEARPLGAEVVDTQDTMRHERRFLVALRMGDPRYFDEVSEKHALAIASTNTEYSFT